MPEGQAPGAVGSPAAGAARPLDEHGFEQRTHREILLVMSGLMVAMLLAMLDNMIVAPALPTIVGELGGLEHLAWVTTAYILGTTIGTPLWGKFGDLFNRKTIFMISILIFLGGSALCGAAQSMTQLIAFRFLQGIGAGGLMVGVMAVLGVLIPPRERGRYMGYFMAIMPVSMIAGPLVGGWITDNASWRWAFYVNIPIGAMALAVIAATMHLPVPEAKTIRIDWTGAALLTTWISALVLVTSWGGTQYAWDSPAILGLIALAAVTFVAFLVLETRVVEPIMPLGVFKNLNFTLAASLSFVVGFGMFGGMTFIPQFQQFVQGASATNSGLLLLPLMIGIIITSLTTGQVVTRTGHYKWFPFAGTVLMTVGLGLLATLGVDAGRVRTGVFMFVLGLGMGMLFQTTMMIAQNSVALKDIGSATAATTFLRSMGGSIGVSMLGALYGHRVTSVLQERLGAANPLGDGTEIRPSLLHTLPGTVVDALQHAITSGIDVVFAWAAPICSVGILIAVFVKQVPLRGSKPAAGAAPAQPAGAPALASAHAHADAEVVVAGVAGVPAAVHGRVSERDGRGLADAVVTLLDTGGHEVGHAVADESGGFRLTPDPSSAGGTLLVVSAVGFVAQVGAIVPDGRLDLVLEALPPRLFGVVHGLREGVAGAAVLTALDEYGALLARTVTRAGGRFAMGGLPTGTVSLVVQSEGYLPSAVDVLMADAPAWVDVRLEPEAGSGPVAVPGEEGRHHLPKPASGEAVVSAGTRQGL